nr:probable E3 ubiquitin-protein ligase RHY1A [Ipomoea batatas]
MVITTTSSVDAINIWFEDSQPPTDGRLYIHNRTRIMVVPSQPGRSVPYIMMNNSDHEFLFNPMLDFESPTDASSFMSAVIGGVEPGAGPEVADEIATAAFSVVSHGDWRGVYGVSIRVVLETIDVLVSTTDDDDDDDSSDLEEEMEDLLRWFDSSVSLGGMSEQELCMLRTEQFQFNGDNEEGECCICLEGFMEGAVITPLAPCSHRFHHSCILQWLRNNPTCPICRTRSRVVPVL